MEKFSAYRDPGTGIQPFLTPVPPVGSDVLAKVTLPLAYTLGVIRTTLALLLAALYLMFVEGLCTILYPIPILGRLITRLLTAVICRTALLVLGLVWIPVENVKRKRGRQQAQSESWNPKAGDIIVSNWASYIELLWLAFRFNPIFVLPVASAHPERVDSRPSSPVTHTPGRRTGTGSANITTATHSTRPTVPIAGFKRASLLSMICNVGNVPKVLAKGNQVKTLDDIRCAADRPIVVFPEGTTSNGRGLLRFAKVFFQDVPVKKFRVFVMCVRYDPPTAMSPTLTTSIPSSWANPLQHIFSITSTLLPATISIRLLAPSESPSSPLFLLNEIAPEALNSDDQLAEVCTTLIAQIGKMKRTGMGWEDKANFFAFYRSKRY